MNVIVVVGVNVRALPDVNVSKVVGGNVRVLPDVDINGSVYATSGRRLSADGSNRGFGRIDIYAILGCGLRAVHTNSVVIQECERRARKTNHQYQGKHNQFLHFPFLHFIMMNYTANCDAVYVTFTLLANRWPAFRALFRLTP